jgi:hypothetical protein
LAPVGCNPVDSLCSPSLSFPSRCLPSLPFSSASSASARKPLQPELPYKLRVSRRTSPRGQGSYPEHPEQLQHCPANPGTLIAARLTHTAAGERINVVTTITGIRMRGGLGGTGYSSRWGDRMGGDRFRWKKGSRTCWNDVQMRRTNR